MDIVQAIKERRSINFFEPGRDLPDGTIRDIVELAGLAPSSMNLQPWRVVVVKDPERKKALRKCAFDQPKTEDASAVLIIVADPGSLEANIDRVLLKWVEMGYMVQDMVATYKGLAAKLYGTEESLQRKFFAVKNASLFAMSIMLAAREFGLETHPMDGFDENCVKREFNVPGDKIVPMLIAIGYLKPGVTLLPRAYRMEVKDYLAFNNYAKEA